jgi:hypothetical protein
MEIIAGPLAAKFAGTLTQEQQQKPESAAKIFYGGWMRYFCWGGETHCDECIDSPTTIAHVTASKDATASTSAANPGIGDARAIFGRIVGTLIQLCLK